MRVVTRQASEGVVIGEDVLVTVLEVAHDHVRLAVESPRQFPTYREHVLYLDDGGSADEPMCERELQLQLQ